MIKSCEICGCVFEPRIPYTKTCSASCKRKLMSKTMAIKYSLPNVSTLYGIPPRVCLICGVEYEPSSGNQLTCSQKCRLALHKQRRLERKQAVQVSEPAALPLHVAEDLCRRLGIKSYGAAGAEAINAGMTTSRYLTLRAEAAGIEIFKEADA